MAGTLIDPQPRLSLAGRTIRSSTRVMSIGGYAVGLATFLEDRGVGIESIYLGHPDVETHVSHLLLGRGVHELETHDVAHSQIPVLYARRRCLYDHLQRLQDFVEGLGLGSLHADVLDETLVALEA